MSPAKRWLGLAGWILLSFTAAAIGSQFPAQPYFSELTKPSWAPPPWLFGPVWSTLYLLMGIAAWLVWTSSDARRRSALTVFVIQLVLNAAWSWIFFGLKNPGAALIEIVALLIAIVITTALFWRIRRAAGALMIPYVAWVTFATVLNATLWRLN